MTYSDTSAPAGRRLVGVEAVIDKDLASAMLAADLGADALLIVTDVDAVYTGWGRPSSEQSGGRRPGRSPRASSRLGPWGPKFGLPARSSKRPAVSL